MAELGFKNTGYNPMGIYDNIETDYGLFTITGILAQNPGKTHLPFKVLASVSTIDQLNRDTIISKDLTDWQNIWSNYTYALLPIDKTQDDLQHMLDKISKDKFTINPYFFKSQPLNKITTGPSLGNESHVSMSKTSLIFLAVLCFIIMLSAGFNYTNLTLARSFTRVKEVGLRKVSGANRWQVFYQFIIEAVIFSLLALLLSLLFLQILQDFFSKYIIDQYISTNFDFGIGLYLIFILFSVLVGVLAGFFPALYISAFNPIQILKNLTNIRLFKNLTLQRGLLLVQFCFSLIFIFSTVMIYRQADHLFHYQFGFNKDNVINVTLYNPDNYARFAHAVSSHKDIISIGACSLLPGTSRGNTTNLWKIDGAKDTLNPNYIDVDAACVDVWGLQLVAGKNLPKIPTTQREKPILINEKLAKLLHFDSPRQAVGQKLASGPNNLEIAGVVKDFQSQSITSDIRPLMLRNRLSEFRYATIRVSGQNNQDVVGFLQSKWKEVNPMTKFEYNFFDEELLKFHSMIANAATTLGFIAFLAVLISCLGLLGMASYTSEVRRKEIGIRKILGSTMQELILLLSKSYVLLIVIAVFMALPIAIFINHAWLNFFPSRVNITIGTIIVSVFFLLAISFSIVFSQSWRVARSNPVDAIKSD